MEFINYFCIKILVSVNKKGSFVYSCMATQFFYLSYRINIRFFFEFSYLLLLLLVLVKLNEEIFLYYYF